MLCSHSMRIKRTRVVSLMRMRDTTKPSKKSLSHSKPHHKREYETQLVRPTHSRYINASANEKTKHNVHNCQHEEVAQ